MKRIVIWPLALLFVMLAGSARADLAEDFAKMLEGLPSHIKVQYQGISASADNSAVTLTQATISYLSSRAKDENDDSQAAPGLSLMCEATAESIIFTQPNLAAFTEEGVVPLAQKVEANNIKVVYPEKDLTLSIKQKVAVNPVGPWARLAALTGDPDKESELLWAMALVRVDELNYLGIIVLDLQAYDSSMVTIEKVNGKNFSLFKCAEFTIDNVKAVSLDGEPDEEKPYFAIAGIKGNYDVSAGMEAVLEKGGPEFNEYSFTHALHTKPSSFHFDARGIKSTDEDVPFTIKQLVVTHQSNPPFEYFGKLVLDTFEMPVAENDGSFITQLLEPALKGKPFVLSATGESRTASGKFLPSIFSITMPNLANLEIKGNFSLSEKYLQLWEQYLNGDMTDGGYYADLPFENAGIFLKASLVKDLTAIYHDKGLINGLLLAFAGDNQDLKQSRQMVLSSLEKQITYEEPGFSQDFLKALKRIVEKPGTMTLTIKPAKPVDMDTLFRQLRDNPKNANYKFTVK